MKFWPVFFVFALFLNVLVGSPQWPSVLAGHLNDPDSYMRLERILQGVQAGHLTNIVARDGPGVVVEWSRLMDALLWVVAAPAAGLVGWPASLFWAGVASGPVLAALLALALAFCAMPYVASRFLWLVPPAVAALPALANYAGPGVVTHHVLLLALIAFTAGCVARAEPFETGWSFLAGVCGGLAVWLTPETMPFVLLCFGLLFVRWVRRPAGAGLAACGAGFLDLVGFGFGIDPPVGGYGVVEADRLSLVYVALGLVLLLAGLLAWRLERAASLRRRRVAGVAGAVVLLGAWALAFPGVMLGPYGLMSPAAARVFFGGIGEMQPAAASAASFGVLWPGVVGLCIAAVICLGRRDLSWCYGLVGLVVVFALGVKFVRFAPVASGASVVLTALALQKVSARWVQRPTLAAAARLGLVAVLLLVPFLPAVARGGAASSGKAGPACDLRAFAPALAVAAGQTLLADVNLSPELLWRSRVIVVGSLYHHGVDGFLRLRADWRAALDTPPAGVDYVLACPGAARTLLVADLPAGRTLWDAVTANRPPAWLRPVATTAPGGYRLYQVLQGP